MAARRRSSSLQETSPSDKTLPATMTPDALRPHPISPWRGHVRERSSSEPNVAHLASLGIEHPGQEEANAKHEIWRILFGPDLTLLVEMSQIPFFSNGQMTASSMIAILRHAGYADTFLKRVLTERIYLSRLTESNDLTNIMRDNSLTVLLIAAYAKVESGTYLKDVLGGVVEDVLKQAPQLEISAAELPPGQDASANRERLAALVNQILQRVWDTRDQFPLVLRSLCAHMRKHSDKRLQKTRAAASTLNNADGLTSSMSSPALVEVPVIEPGTLRLLGCFIFLRFIGPAIAAPTNSSLHDGRAPLTKEERRALILVAKALNNLAADSLRVQREDATSYMADLLEPMMDLMTRILMQFSTLPEDAPVKLSASVSTLSSPVAAPEMPVTHEIAIDNVVQFLGANMRKIEDQLKVSKPHLLEVLDLIKVQMAILEASAAREQERRAAQEASSKAGRRRGKSGVQVSASMQELRDRDSEPSSPRFGIVTFWKNRRGSNSSAGSSRTSVQHSISVPTLTLPETIPEEEATKRSGRSGFFASIAAAIRHLFRR